MSLNSHFKNFILGSLLNSPAWVALLDSVLSLLEEGTTFLYKFPLFLGRDKEGVDVSTLPSPAYEEGFNPVWVDSVGVEGFLNMQGFSEDFLSSLEMLPTGLGRLNCTSPYMFFKVLSSFPAPHTVPRASFQFFEESLLPIPNERLVPYFLELTSFLGDGLFSYRSLSPLRDGDILLDSLGSELQPILSYTEDLVELDSGTSLGYHPIKRTDALTPTLSTDRLLVWSYPGTPSQLVYDRYSPLHSSGTSVHQSFFSSISIRLVVPNFTISSTYWLVERSVLDLFILSNPKVSDGVPDAIPESMYKFDMSDWEDASYGFGKVFEFVCLTNWSESPYGSHHSNAYLFNSLDFNYLYEYVEEQPIHALDGQGSDSPMCTVDGIPIYSRAEFFRMIHIDTEVYLLFDPLEDFSFGFDSFEDTFFRWDSLSGVASFAGFSQVVVLEGSVWSLRVKIKDLVASVYLNGVLFHSTDPMSSTSVFPGFSEGLVYYLRSGSTVVSVDSEGVYIDDVVSAHSYVESSFPLVSLFYEDYNHPVTDVSCASSFSLFIHDYSVPLRVKDSFDVSWSDVLSFSWGLDLKQLSIGG